ncbi:P-loop containing nucleoside triphosphate hydrolase protein [Gorgonomyces haynaldii]|nr:P-loop containing nucleoside triphosphate hydrolase protein [Gorgonomyces haynaldii]
MQQREISTSAAQTTEWSGYTTAKNSLNFILNQAKLLAQQYEQMEIKVSDQELSILKKQNIFDSLRDMAVHMDKLEVRLQDARARVLVTGDLNAGKSTFVNTLLRRQVVPDDQQPCTSLFVEVVDAAQNQDREEIHAFREFEDNHEILALDGVRELVEENAQNYKLLRVYCHDSRGDKSLLHNGVVDVSLIDSPGLNIDSMKTTSLFSKQQEIDVIVFVVNAENHFTLSGREFLSTALKEKAFIFIVVNKFDSIRRKDRCKSDILEQIRSISQSTFEEADSLVHFVSARNVFTNTNEQEWVDVFDHLESSLRSFIVEKRFQSKLAPIRLYLDNALDDLIHVSNYNASYYAANMMEQDLKISKTQPDVERMETIKTQHIATIDSLIESTAANITTHVISELSSFIDEIDIFLDAVEWEGFWNAWFYANTLRQVVFKLTSIRVRREHEFAKAFTLKSILKFHEQVETLLPSPIPMDTSIVDDTFSKLSLENEVESSMVRFDTTDTFDILQDYIPSLGFILLGFTGYQGLGWSALNLTTQMSKIGKMSFSAIAIGGIGFLVYSLAEMQTSIKLKTAKKTRTYLENAKFTAKTADLLSSTSRTSLRKVFWTYQNNFQNLYLKCASELEQQKKRKDDNDIFQRHFASLFAKTQSLKQQLSHVHLQQQ